MPGSDRTPSWLLALGREGAPEEIVLADERYRLERVFKHDFFAFTALYGGGRRRVVLKIGRKASLCGLPLAWIGRLHAWHESRCFREVQDLEIVPRFTGRWGRHGLTHEFVQGHPLERGERVPDDFFDRLRSGLREIHERKMAYVDLEKPENVLVGDDGRPYLFDFQISWHWPARFGGDLWPLSFVRRWLQNSDVYHVQKLQRRTRPDLMSAADLSASHRRPLHIKLYGGLTRPITRLRRRVLNRVDPVKKRGERGRVRPTSPVE